MNEQTPTITSPENSYGATYRVLSLRMSEETKAQLEVLAQLNQRSVTVEARLALESWVERSKTDPETRKRAEVARAEIEREADTRRRALEAVIGSDNKNPTPTPKTTAAKPATTKP